MEQFLLPKPDFLNRLKSEKRRVDRSKSPLTIALFRILGKKSDHRKSVGELLISLNRNTRETDVKGWLAPNVIGLILPDTDEKGARSCLEKILNGNADRYSMVLESYPGHLFQKLLTEEKDTSNLSAFEIDEPLKSHKIQYALKRAMDILGSLFGLFVSSPLMLVTAIAVKVNSPGPIIFRQPRLGMKGRRFPFYKFRSMYVNGDDRIHRDYVTNLIKGNLDKINKGDRENPLYKLKDDPRVTPVGKIIRKTSMDELPQFFNVLKGEMSLVGPRPPIPYEVEKYEPWHLRRILEVKPGITGLWQVDGRSKTSFDDMVRLDLRYVLHWSLWLDIKILIRTVKAVLRPNGAV